MKSLSESSKLGPENSAGADMAILSLCNHLVLSRGTFGAWASFLSGETQAQTKNMLWFALISQVLTESFQNILMRIWTRSSQEIRFHFSISLKGNCLDIRECCFVHVILFLGGFQPNLWTSWGKNAPNACREFPWKRNIYSSMERNWNVWNKISIFVLF